MKKLVIATVAVLGLLFVQLEANAAEGERTSGSGLNLAQMSDEQSTAGRKRYEAAAERARAALAAEKSAGSANKAPPHIPDNTKSDMNGAVCIAGC